MTYSVNNINIDKTYTGELISITPSVAIDLSQSNMYKLSLDAAYDLTFSNAATTTYNFIIEPNGFTFSLGTGNFKVPEGTFEGATSSMLMSSIYDGTDMWVTSVKNISDLNV